MKKLLVTIILGVVLMFSFHKTNAEQAGSAYDYSFKTLIGNKDMSLAAFKGKVLLIVNTASECGFTKQYEALEEIYEKYKDQGLVVIGVPSNDFGKQEPGSSEEIAQFCKLNYGVTFPMAAKEVVKGGNAHPFYKWAAETLGFGTAPKWNFHKYVVDKNGKLVEYFNSPTEPDSKAVIEVLERLLAE
jgi:glutathione peroxidase